VVIEYPGGPGQSQPMSRHIISIALAVSLFAATQVNADCYADYKAKQDNPLQLHYGVIRIPDAACGDAGMAAQEVRGRIAKAGWELLSIVSTFDDDGLGQRRESAGEFFLRF